MRTSLQQGFVLGPYTIKPLTGEVSGSDGSKHLQPKAVDVLMCLVEKQGELVTHEEILDSVWGDPEHSHEVLSHAVGAIRAALNDDADSPTFIRTLSKRGYQLLKPISPIDDRRRDTPIPVDSRVATGDHGLAALWRRLQKRNVVRVSVAYAAVSWLLLQVSETVFEALAFPSWALRMFVVVLAVGFLIAVLLAWIYQIVPEERSGPSTSQRSATWLRYGVDGGIIVVLAIGVFLVGYRQFVDKPVFEFTEPELPELAKKKPGNYSVAVLRFASLGGDSQFSDGLAENLLHMLSGTKELFVPSRSTTWGLAESTTDIPAIAEELRVRYVLEGSVQEEAGNIRVVAQLIDAGTGDHVWSESYDRPLTAGSFFATQDDIAREVVNKIQVTLSEHSSANLYREHTDNLDALRNYLAGREYLRRPMAPETLGPAVTEFQTAIRLDPEYAQAYAGLCEAYLGWFVTNRSSDDFDAAERECLRAAEMDDSLPEVYAAMGSLHRYAGRYSEAEVQLKKALELSPDSVPVLEELGRTYRADKRLLEARQAFQSAIEAEPRSWSVYKSMGNFLFRTGSYGEALPYYRQVITLEPDDPAGYNNLAVTLFMVGRFNDANVAWNRIISDSPTRLTYVNYANSLYYSRNYQESIDMYQRALDMDGDDYRVWRSMAASMLQLDSESPKAGAAYEKSIELAREALRVNPEDRQALSQIAVSYARMGSDELARENLRRLNELGWENPNMTYMVALANHLLGDDANAIRELERAVLMGFPRPLISEDPDFQTLNSNKRYLALLTTVSVPGT